MRKGKSGLTPFTSGRAGNSEKRGNSKTGGSWKRREKDRINGQETVVDYSVYTMTPLQWAEALAMGALLAGAVAYACYRSWVVFLVLLMPMEVVVPIRMRDRWKQKRLMQLESQFKEAIQIIAASLSAGLSVENAIASSGRELGMMYGPESMMCGELSLMVQQMNMNRPVEELMSEFAARSGLEEVDNFARIFQIAKRSGGQLVPIIRHTVQIMDERYQVKEEIRTLTASKKFEQRIMNAMPLLIIIYIDTTSPGFFDVMYTTMMGRIVMTVCLGVYLLACWLAGKILDIEVA